jgi:2-polyprenyl-3-methyl-5-hydroxy-6-metoxy-1,4-benzoquinol methylase
MSDYVYQGHELDLFQHAVHWKQYYATFLTPYIKGDVLEVGAGIGGTTRVLCDGSPRAWTCLEPDAQIAARLEAALDERPLPVPARVQTGTLEDLPRGHRFDTILYIDVLEHIENDRVELTRAAGRLAPLGHLIVLSPAHNWLFSPFDTAIGHYRRYSKSTLLAAAPATVQIVRVFYLDSVGMTASLANRLLLKASQPTLAQIGFWDRNLVRISRTIDPLLGYHLGKTVIGIWQRASSS